MLWCTLLLLFVFFAVLVLVQFSFTSRIVLAHYTFPRCTFPFVLAFFVVLMFLQFSFASRIVPIRSFPLLQTLKLKIIILPPALLADKARPFSMRIPTALARV